MNAVLKTLFIIGMITLITQTVRHAYLRWFDTREPSRNMYNESISEDTGKSLDELLQKYDESSRKVKEYESNKANPIIPYGERNEVEPYKSVYSLNELLDKHKEHERRIFEVRFFWVSGFALLLIGFACYRRVNIWIGLSLIITAFIEMIAYTSSSGFYYQYAESNTLLTNEFVFSLVTLILLIITAFRLEGTLEE